MAGQIVVGVDGSAGALRAVEWAADEAARTGAELKIVYATDRSAYLFAKFPQSRPNGVDRATRQLIGAASRCARARQPQVSVTTEVIEGGAVRVLRYCAASATEIVVGGRGLGGLAGVLLGSVSGHVAGHTPCPVIVVGAVSPESRREVVVGIADGADCDAAIAYAFEQAARSGATLRAVHASHVGQAETAWSGGGIAARLAPYAERHPGVTIVEDVRPGHSVDVLAEASHRADLLVVGSRGRGSAGAIVLGSVSRAMLHHAHCPVAVVPLGVVPVDGRAGGRVARVRRHGVPSFAR